MARNEYASYEAGDNQRKAIGNSNTSIIPLPANASLANGHFIAGSTGWTAITAHAANDTSTQYRVQLNNNGDLAYYTSTDGGSTWSYVGIFRRSDQIAGWRYAIGTLHSNITSGSVVARYNYATQTAYLNIAIYVGTAISGSNPILASGLPIPLGGSWNFVMSQTGTANIRCAVNTSGGLVAYASSIATGWWSGSVAYPYSAL